MPLWLTEAILQLGLAGLAIVSRPLSTFSALAQDVATGDYGHATGEERYAFSGSQAAYPLQLCAQQTACCREELEAQSKGIDPYHEEWCVLP